MKRKIIKVIRADYYIVKMHDEHRTEINGWDIGDVIDDWFISFPLRCSHASRDGHKMGGLAFLLGTEVIDEKDFEKELTIMREQGEKE